MTAPTMDERRAVARRMREYEAPVLASHQTTREAVDAVVECMGLEADEEMCTVRYFLDRLADLIDPGDDTTVSAYDMLPEDDRAAIAWVREHGGVGHVKDQGEALARRLSALAREAVAGADPEAEAEAMDVLERAVNCRLMPEGMEWPMVDGEPVVISERLVGYGSGDDGYEVVGVRPTCGWVLVKSCDHIHRDEGPVILEWDASKCHRPEPKVLDADGVEIRVGDTVYRKSDGKMVEVAEVYEKTFTDSDGYIRPGDGYTHRAPVLAADGKPLREGEMVWGTGREQHEYIVLGQPGLGGGAGRFKVTCRDVTDDVDCYCDPSQLTHERPDSWERLEKDMRCLTQRYLGPEPDITRDFIDLVRRARALAGVGD